MAISYVGAGTISAATSSPVTVDLPAGLAEGDLIVIACHVAGDWDQLASSAIDYTATGYDLLAEGGLRTFATAALLFKVAGAAESDPEVSVSQSAASGVYCQAVAWRGVAVDVIDAGSVATFGNGGTQTGAPMETMTDGAVMASIVCQSPNGAGFTFGTSQGFTLRLSNASTVGVDGSIGVADKPVASASQAAPTWNSVASTSDWVTFSVAFRAADELSSGITFRYGSAMRVGGGTTITAPLTQVDEDDLLVVHVATRNESAVVTPETGYVLEATDVDVTLRGRLYSKVADGSETDVTFTISTDSNSWSLVATTFRNVDSSEPFDVDSVTDSAGSTATFAAPDLTTATDDALAVSFAANGESTAVTLSSAEGFQRVSSTGWRSTYADRRSLGAATQHIATAGAVTFPTWTAASNGWVGISSALRQAEPPTPPPPSGGGNRMGDGRAIRKPPRTPR